MDVLSKWVALGQECSVQVQEDMQAVLEQIATSLDQLVASHARQVQQKTNALRHQVLQEG